MRKVHFLRICITALAILLLPAFNVLAGQHQHRVVDDDDTVTLHGNTHPRVYTANPDGASDPSMPMERMVLTLALDADKDASLHETLAGQQDPSSPSYHAWLTPVEFGQRFGQSADNVAVVTAWLTGHGFIVEEVSPGNTSITFSGTVARVNRAFHTSIHNFNSGGKRYHANISDPLIPRALADLVSGVVSLHNFPRKPMNSGALAVASQASTPAFTNGSNHYLSPADFASIYNVNALYGAGVDGTGQSIAIVGRTRPATSNWSSFRSMMGLPANPAKVIINGADPGDVSSDEDGEANLDVEWSGAVAKNAQIIFVTSKSTSTDGVDLSAQYIVSNNIAPIMSISFGSCESAMGAAENAFYNNLWKQAAAQGITVFVSSGDSGSAGCEGGGNSRGSLAAVSGLASTPYNVAVGGTQFNEGTGSYWNSSNGSSAGTTYNSAKGYIPEASWNESANVTNGSGLWATGGGSSSLYPKPSWQAAPGVPNDSRRDVPDVSLSAASHDGYLAMTGNQLYSFGGTSASSPAFAGLMALVLQKTGQRQGNANLRFYQLASAQYGASGPAVFHDITAGNNSVPGVVGYSATGGYDLATGLGSVDAFALVNNWSLPVTYFVSGVISSGASALPGAAVSIGNVSATTGSDGSYSLADIAAGGCTITVSKAGYLTQTASLDVSSNISKLNYALPPQPTYAVSGTVRAGSSSGTLLAGASISVAGSTVLSNSAGAFSVAGIPAGTYAMSVSLPGYTSFVNVALTVAANQSVNVVLIPLSYTVSGTVRAGSSGGALLPGVTVALAGKTATTDGGGAYSVGGIPAGSYQMTVSLPGYASATSSVAVTANQTVNAVVVPINYTVSGVVKAASGAVLPNATVSLGGKTATTDAKGAFSFAGITVGTYTLSVALPGYTTFANAALPVNSDQAVSVTLTPLPPTYTVTGVVSSAFGTGVIPGAVVTIGPKSTVVPAGTTIYSISGLAAGVYATSVTNAGYLPYTGTVTITGSQNLNFVITPISYAIAGQVQANGAALAGATVSVAGKTATSDSNGSFSIANVLPGTYALSVAKAGYVTFTTASLSVAANQSLAITLNPVTYTVMGIVSSTSGSGLIPGALVTIGSRSATVAASGIYSVSGVSSGVNQVTVVCPGYLTYTGTATVSTVSTQSLNFTLTPVTYNITGLVQANGAPLAGATISLAGKTATSDSNGAFSIATVLPGTYAFGVTKAGYTAFSNASFAVAADQSLVVTLVQQSFSVNGVIKSANTGLALPGATITIAGKTVTAGADGTFSIAGVPGGNYPYTISGPAAAVPAYTVITGSLGVSGNVAGLQYLVYQPVYHLTGVVTGPGWSGLMVGATVTIGSKSTVVPASGIYMIDGLAPGSYPVSVTKTGYAPYSNSAVAVTAIQVLNFTMASLK